MAAAGGGLETGNPHMHIYSVEEGQLPKNSLIILECKNAFSEKMTDWFFCPVSRHCMHCTVATRIYRVIVKTLVVVNRTSLLDIFQSIHGGMRALMS